MKTAEEIAAELRTVYPKGSEAGLMRLAETVARIDSRIRADAEERKEMRLALLWCRSHGNPHIGGPET